MDLNNKILESKNKSNSNTPKPPELESNSIIQTARIKSTNKPVYPRRAIIKQQQGIVKVKLQIDIKGKASNIEIVESSKYKLLDNSVVDFTKKAEFIPGTINKKPSVTTQIFSFEFILQ